MKIEMSRNECILVIDLLLREYDRLPTTIRLSKHYPSHAQKLRRRMKRVEKLRQSIFNQSMLHGS